MTGSPVRLGLPFVNRALSEFKRMPEVVGREVDWEAAVAQALARPAETTGSDLADGIQPSNVDVIDLAHSRQARRPRTAVIALSSAACLLLVAVGAAALARQESPSAATPPSGTSSVIDTSNAPTSPQPTTPTTSATTVSTPPPSSTPEITSVSAVTPAAQQTIVISGSGFGTLATPFVGSLPCFAVYNQTANWYAGHIDPLNSGRTSFGACDAPLSVMRLPPASCVCNHGFRRMVRAIAAFLQTSLRRHLSLPPSAPPQRGSRSHSRNRSDTSPHAILNNPLPDQLRSGPRSLPHVPPFSRPFPPRPTLPP